MEQPTPGLLAANPLARVPALERNVAVGALVLSLVLTTVKFWASAVTGSAAVLRREGLTLAVRDVNFGSSYDVAEGAVFRIWQAGGA